MKPVKDEIDLHGMTVDEVLPRIDEFLHNAFRGGLYRVWIVHGKGSGVLRQEVRRYLSTHPLVKGCRQADGGHGGYGATEVDLSDW